MAQRGESPVNHSETIAKPERTSSEDQAKRIVIIGCLHRVPPLPIPGIWQPARTYG